jgi:transposase
MASKGQTFQKWDNELVNKIKKDLKDGCSARELARKYSVPRGTISNWQLQQRYPEKYSKLGTRGRPKESELTKEDYKERYEILKKYQAFLKAQRERK